MRSSRRCWYRRRRGYRTGTETEAKAAAAAPQSEQAVADQHRVALVEAHPHVDVAQRYQHLLLTRMSRLSSIFIFHIVETSQ